MKHCTPPIAAFVRQLKQIGQGRSNHVAPSTRRFFTWNYTDRRRARLRTPKLAKDSSGDHCTKRETLGSSCVDQECKRKRKPSFKGQGVQSPCRPAGRESRAHSVTDHAQESSGKRSYTRWGPMFAKTKVHMSTRLLHDLWDRAESSVLPTFVKSRVVPSDADTRHGTVRFSFCVSDELPVGYYQRIHPGDKPELPFKELALRLLASGLDTFLRRKVVSLERETLPGITHYPPPPPPRPASENPESEMLLDDFLARIKIHAERKKKSFEKPAEKKWAIGQEFRHRSDPLKPSNYRRWNEAVHRIGLQIEKTYGAWLLADDEAKKKIYDPRLDSLLAERQNALDHSFGIFAWLIGARDTDTPLRFDKKLADAALESAIGSANRTGNRLFQYDPSCKELNFADDNDAARGFSIYLGRKGYCNNDPRSAHNETLAFADRVGNPPPPLTPPQTTRRSRMLSLIERMARVLFKVKNPAAFVPRAPNSGKACLELPRSEGGKRHVLYRLRSVGNDRHVRADTIISAGKFRTITVSSAYFSRFSWLNEFMFSRLRGCNWLVSGGTVEDWADTIAATVDRSKIDSFSSGDGKSCTDYFDSAFCDAVLGVLADQFGLPLEELQAITTKALIEIEPETFVRQVRGQLMGSDFSFPILCMISFLVHLEAEGLTDSWLAMREKEFRDTLIGYAGCGVNGDDIVDWGSVSPSSSPSSRWLAAFALVGGVAAPAKSPHDREFFTINSQLWRWPLECDRPYKIGSILPAMLLGVCGKAHLAPDEAWADLLLSPLLSPEAIAESQLDLTLLPEIPRSLGGLGQLIPPRDALTVRRYLWAIGSRRRNWNAIVDYDAENLSAHNGRYSVGAADDVSHSQGFVSGWIPTAEKKAIAIRRFGSPRALFWSEQAGLSPDLPILRQWIYWRSKLVSVKELTGLLRERTFMESSGWSLVRRAHPAECSRIIERDVSRHFANEKPASLYDDVRQMIHTAKFREQIDREVLKRHSRFSGRLTMATPFWA